MSTRAKVKAAVLPHGQAVRRLPSGIGRGLRLGVDFQQGHTGLYVGLYEIELNRHLRRIARRGHRSFDIGGNIGYDALVLAKLTGQQVLSVESEPDLAAALQNNVAANPGLAPITVEVGFVSDDESDTHVTIDGLAQRHFLPDVIKMDIEGAEVAALRGATAVLRSRRPAVLLEVHGKDFEWDCLALMRQAGYDPPTVVDRRRWLPDHRPIEHNRWLVFEG